jgi:hypothetical protein
MHSSLTDNTMASLQASFLLHNNYPSAEHLAALRAVAQTMEDMANSTAQPCVFLAALDPGIGKTQTTIHFIRALMASEAHRGVGMVVCLGRKSEIEAIANDLSLPAGALGVLTRDDRINGLGTAASPGDAQVLLTTQQMVASRTERSLFLTTESLFYRGKPRAVRVWDEAFEWATPIALRWSGISSLIGIAEDHCETFSKALFDFATKVAALKTGDCVEVPNFEREHSISWRAIEAQLVSGDSPDRKALRKTVRDLRALNGTIACAHVENTGRMYLLSYEQRLPTDILPILVLDASIRVRGTYRDMRTHRGGFVELPRAIKDYSDLIVHIWKESGSKSAFSTNGDTIVQGIVDTIHTKPNDTWLVVTHKTGPLTKDIKARILALMLPSMAAKVSFLTFGNHLATNAHVEVANVILAGQLFTRTSSYVALTHAAQGRPMADGLASKEDVVAIMKGEMTDLTLQAITRGRCRKSNGPKAFPMDAYIMAPTHSGLADTITTIFPGCRVKVWKPAKGPLTGHFGRAVEYVRLALEEGRTTIPYKEVYEALGIGKANFSRRISTTEEWLEEVSKMGCTIHRGTKGALSIRPPADALNGCPKPMENIPYGNVTTHNKKEVRKGGRKGLEEVQNEFIQDID